MTRSFKINILWGENSELINVKKKKNIKYIFQNYIKSYVYIFISM